MFEKEASFSLIYRDDVKEVFSKVYDQLKIAGAHVDSTALTTDSFYLSVSGTTVTTFSIELSAKEHLVDFMKLYALAQELVKNLTTVLRLDANKQVILTQLRFSDKDNHWPQPSACKCTLNLTAEDGHDTEVLSCIAIINSYIRVNYSILKTEFNSWLDTPLTRGIWFYRKATFTINNEADKEAVDRIVAYAKEVADNIGYVTVELVNN